MIRLEQELLQEVNWRTNELSIIRTIPLQFNFSDQQNEILKKYSVAAIYSIWEGFVTQSFTLYIREINSLNLTYDKINLNILTHDIFMKFDPTEEKRKHFKHKCEFIDNVFEYSKSPVTISPKIPTKGNVNFKVTNQILKHFNLEELPKNDFDTRLSKLLMFRNNIAHGECSLVVTKEIIQDFNLTVIDTMHEITIRIIEGFASEKYLNDLSS